MTYEATDFQGPSGHSFWGYPRDRIVLIRNQLKNRIFFSDEDK